MSVRELAEYPVQEFSENGAGSNKKWTAALKFPVGSKENVSVYVRIESPITGGALTKLNVDKYAVKIREDIVGGIYADVEIKGSPFEDGEYGKVFAVRETVRDQRTDFTRVRLQSNAYSDVLNASLDKLTMEIQDIGDLSLRISPDDMERSNDAESGKKIDLTLPSMHGHSDQVLAVRGDDDGNALGFEFISLDTKQDKLTPQNPIDIDADNNIRLKIDQTLGVDSQGQLTVLDADRYWHERDGSLQNEITPTTHGNVKIENSAGSFINLTGQAIAIVTDAFELQDGDQNVLLKMEDGDLVLRRGIGEDSPVATKKDITDDISAAALWEAAGDVLKPKNSLENKGFEVKSLKPITFRSQVIASKKFGDINLASDVASLSLTQEKSESALDIMGVRASSGEDLDSVMILESFHQNGNVVDFGKQIVVFADKDPQIVDSVTRIGRTISTTDQNLTVADNSSISKTGQAIDVKVDTTTINKNATGELFAIIPDPPEVFWKKDGQYLVNKDSNSFFNVKVEGASAPHMIAEITADISKLNSVVGKGLVTIKAEGNGADGPESASLKVGETYESPAEIALSVSGPDGASTNLIVKRSGAILNGQPIATTNQIPTAENNSPISITTDKKLGLKHDATLSEATDGTLSVAIQPDKYTPGDAIRFDDEEAGYIAIDLEELTGLPTGTFKIETNASGSNVYAIAGGSLFERILGVWFPVGGPSGVGNIGYSKKRDAFYCVGKTSDIWFRYQISGGAWVMGWSPPPDDYSQCIEGLDGYPALRSPSRVVRYGSYDSSTTNYLSGGDICYCPWIDYIISASNNEDKGYFVAYGMSDIISHSYDTCLVFGRPGVMPDPLNPLACIVGVVGVIPGVSGYVFIKTRFVKGEGWGQAIFSDVIPCAIASSASVHYAGGTEFLIWTGYQMITSEDFTPVRNIPVLEDLHELCQLGDGSFLAYGAHPLYRFRVQYKERATIGINVKYGDDFKVDSGNKLTLKNPVEQLWKKDGPIISPLSTDAILQIGVANGSVEPGFTGCYLSCAPNDQIVLRALTPIEDVNGDFVGETVRSLGVNTDEKDLVLYCAGSEPGDTYQTRIFLDRAGLSLLREENETPLFETTPFALISDIPTADANSAISIDAVTKKATVKADEVTIKTNPTTGVLSAELPAEVIAGMGLQYGYLEAVDFPILEEAKECSISSDGNHGITRSDYGDICVLENGKWIKTADFDDTVQVLIDSDGGRYFFLNSNGEVYTSLDGSDWILRGDRIIEVLIASKGSVVYGFGEEATGNGDKQYKIYSITPDVQELYSVTISSTTEIFARGSNSSEYAYMFWTHSASNVIRGASIKIGGASQEFNIAAEANVQKVLMAEFFDEIILPVGANGASEKGLLLIVLYPNDEYGWILLMADSEGILTGINWKGVFNYSSPRSITKVGQDILFLNGGGAILKGLNGKLVFQADNANSIRGIRSLYGDVFLIGPQYPAMIVNQNALMVAPGPGIAVGLDGVRVLHDETLTTDNNGRLSVAGGGGEDYWELVDVDFGECLVNKYKGQLGTLMLAGEINAESRAEVSCASLMGNYSAQMMAKMDIGANSYQSVIAAGGFGGSGVPGITIESSLNSINGREYSNINLSSNEVAIYSGGRRIIVSDVGQFLDSNEPNNQIARKGEIPVAVTGGDGISVYNGVVSARAGNGIEVNNQGIHIRLGTGLKKQDMLYGYEYSQGPETVFRFDKDYDGNIYSISENRVYKNFELIYTHSEINVFYDIKFIDEKIILLYENKEGNCYIAWTSSDGGSDPQNIMSSGHARAIIKLDDNLRFFIITLPHKGIFFEGLNPSTFDIDNASAAFNNGNYVRAGFLSHMNDGYYSGKIFGIGGELATVTWQQGASAPTFSDWATSIDYSVEIRNVCSEGGGYMALTENQAFITIGWHYNTGADSGWDKTLIWPGVSNGTARGIAKIPGKNWICAVTNSGDGRTYYKQIVNDSTGWHCEDLQIDMGIRYQNEAGPTSMIATWDHLYIGQAHLLEEQNGHWSCKLGTSALVAADGIYVPPPPPGMTEGTLRYMNGNIFWQSDPGGN